MTRETERIADQLRRAWEGDAWHGPPLKKALDGLTARQAAAHPIAGAHSIWDLALHIAAWQERRQRSGREAGHGGPRRE